MNNINYLCKIILSSSLGISLFAFGMGLITDQPILNKKLVIASIVYNSICLYYLI